MEQRFYDAVISSPIITAVKDDEGLKQSLDTDSQVIFVLYGNVCNINDIVETIKEHDKIAMVHIDLIEGLSAKEEAVDFLKKFTRADGIISTRPHLVKRAQALEMYTILRIFVIDSMALANVSKQYQSIRPDIVEILPGVMPKVIKNVCKMIKTPVIAGGLITDKEDIINALEAGATAISTTNPKVWSM